METVDFLAKTSLLDSLHKLSISDWTNDCFDVGILVIDILVRSFDELPFDGDDTRILSECIVIELGKHVFLQLQEHEAGYLELDKYCEFETVPLESLIHDDTVKVWICEANIVLVASGHERVLWVGAWGCVMELVGVCTRNKNKAKKTLVYAGCPPLRVVSQWFLNFIQIWEWRGKYKPKKWTRMISEHAGSDPTNLQVRMNKVWTF